MGLAGAGCSMEEDTTNLCMGKEGEREGEDGEGEGEGEEKEMEKDRGEI